MPTYPAVIAVIDIDKYLDLNGCHKFVIQTFTTYGINEFII